MPDIFVSYARSTESQARAITAELRALGYDVWSDEELPVHRAYAEVLEEQLSNARVVLVVWSADAAKSKWVRAEAEMALETDKLVQLTVDGVLPPLPFNQIECANIADWTGNPAAQGWRKVLSSVEHLIAQTDLISGPELRQLTVLSCGLVKVAEGSIQPGSEDSHNIAKIYHNKVAEAVERFNGHTSRAMGNNIVVFFGYPVAQEDAASRAAHAGFAIIDRIREVNGELASVQKIRLSVQVGIHTGRVVVTLGGDDEIFGDVPDIAVLAQRSAAPDSVVITGAVRDLLADSFHIEALEIEKPNWVDQQIELYRVDAPTQLGSRVKNSTLRERSPFLGRQDEIQLMLSRWTRVREGDGQMLLLVGEPGIGKTRVTEEFATLIQSDAHVWRQCSGDPFRKNTPFYAVTQLLEHVLDARSEESAELLLERLENTLGPSGVDLTEGIPLIAEMLKLDYEPRYSRSMLSAELKRQKVLEILTTWLFGAAPSAPLILVIEDLHWLDPSTLELLRILFEQGATAPLYLLCTARVEGRPQWPMRTHHTHIMLDRLSNSLTQKLVGSVDSRLRLRKSVENAIVERSGGVPFFAEELARLVIDRGKSLSAHEIPLTLQASLEARLDTLGSAKQVAQIGAVIGRRFSYTLLLAVSQMREAQLRSALEKLADTELVYVRGSLPDQHYEFKHSLIQDAAYEALVRNRRRELHARVAETILNRDPGLAIEHPEVLAAHWEGAGETARAISAWTSAGKLATSRYAYEEALKCYRQALALVTTPGSVEVELRLQSYIVGALQITCGYSAEETMEATLIARRMAEKQGDVRIQFKHTNEEWAATSSAGDYLRSSQHADKLLTLAQAIAKPRQLATAYMASVTTKLRTGDLVEAERSFTSGLRYFQTNDFLQAGGAVAQVYGNAAINALIMGNEADARSRIQVVHDRIETSENPYDIAFSQHMSGRLDLMMAENRSAEKRALDCIELSTRGGFSQFAATSSIVLGKARAELGLPEAGLELIKQGLASMSKTGNRAAITHYLNWLAETYAQCGMHRLALQTIEEALTINPHEICYRADSLRVRAEILFELDSEERGRTDLDDALALAKSIGAQLYWQAAMDVLKSRVSESVPFLPHS